MQLENFIKDIENQLKNQIGYIFSNKEGIYWFDKSYKPTAENIAMLKKTRKNAIILNELSASEITANIKSLTSLKNLLIY